MYVAHKYGRERKTEIASRAKNIPLPLENRRILPFQRWICSKIRKSLIFWIFGIFIKVQFDLENIRVLALNSIKTLNLLVSMLTGWLSSLAAKKGDSLLLERIFKCAKRIYVIPQFTLYAFADGIFEILSKTFSGIVIFLKRKQPLSPSKPRSIRYYIA